MEERLKSLTRTLAKSCETYQGFVKRNIDLFGEIEAGLKWISYVVAGQSKDTSPVLSELLYASSNILLLINDTIIRQATRKDNNPPVKILWILNDDHFRVALTLIDYLEVFVEYSCLRIWGSRGKWLAIAVVQLCKTILRLICLIKQHVGFLLSPPIPPLTSKQRKLAQQLLSNNESNVKPTEEGKNPGGISMSFTLKRSGRTIRTVSAAPTVLGRSWKVPKESNPGEDAVQLIEESLVPTALDPNKFYAELVHIVRPIAHLFALQLCGLQSWKPWLMALGMDVTSLRLIGDPVSLNRLEKRELRLRSWGLLYYLLRSPFFDRHTKEKIARVLGMVSNSVPGARFICNPLIEYLPTWQKVYFYTWNN